MLIDYSIPDQSRTGSNVIKAVPHTPKTFRIELSKVEEEKKIEIMIHGKYFIIFINDILFHDSLSLFNEAKSISKISFWLSI